MANFGGQLASKIASVVADATIATRSRAAPLQEKAFMATQDSFFRLVGGEIRDTMGELFTLIADDPDAPEWAKRTFNFLGRGHGQWQAFLAQSMAGQALSVGLGELINNFLGPTIRRIISQDPGGVLSLDAMIQEVARGKRELSDTGIEIAGHGLNQREASRLINLQQHGLAPGDTLDALNRGLIPESIASFNLRDAGFSHDADELMRRLRQMKITPQEAATLENFGVINRDEGHQIARASGLADDDYDKLALGGGQPPPLEVLYDALRRGIIDGNRFDKGIQQGPIRVEWADVIERLKVRNAPVATALDAATQNLLSKSDAQRIWTEEGFPPDAFDWALESAGRPLSPTEAGELFNRGIMSESDVRQMFLESNIKNKYVDLVFRLAERLPPMELTVRMVREGAMTQQEGVTNLRQLGFNQRYAQALIDLGVRESLAETRDLSISTIQELYESKIIGRGTALDGLKAHGYSDEAAEWVLSIRDLRRERSRLDSAVNRVRSRFVAGRIDQRDAENALDALLVPADARDDFLDIWEIERDVSRPLLTTSQIQQSVRRGLFTPTDGVGRLLERGYSEDDAVVLIQLVASAPAGG